MQVESSIIIAASPDKIFNLYADVENWPSWDPDTKAATIQGPFRTGASGRLTPTKGNAVPMVLTEVVENKSFTAESKIPLFKMVFEYVLTPVADGTHVLHRVTFSGPLTFLLGRVLRAQLRRGLPVTLASLKRKVEQGGA